MKYLILIITLFLFSCGNLTDLPQAGGEKSSPEKINSNNIPMLITIIFTDSTAINYYVDTVKYDGIALNLTFPKNQGNQSIYFNSITTFTINK